MQVKQEDPQGNKTGTYYFLVSLLSWLNHNLASYGISCGLLHITGVHSHISDPSLCTLPVQLFLPEVILHTYEEYKKQCRYADGFRIQDQVNSIL